MRNATRYFIIAALLLWMAACGDFGDTNVDPNRPVSVAPETLLTSSLQSIRDLQSLYVPLAYVQLITESLYATESQFITTHFSFYNWYTGPLAKLQHIIQLNMDASTKMDASASGSNANQIAVARILKAYFFHILTDRWGPIPYSEALQGRENFRPKYDSQQFIYTDLLKELKEAVAQMDDGPGVKGDFLFGGDMDRWAKFANSLRAIIALRMSYVDPGTARSEFISAVDSGFIMDDVMYPYLAESANENPWYSHFKNVGNRAVTTTMVNYMKPLGDPRLDRYADPAPNYGEVVGMPYGIDTAGNIPFEDVSLPGYPAVRGQDAPIAIMTMAQMYFSQAEAIERGWMNGNAQTMYEEAIMASWQQWGVMDQDTFEVFIAQPEVAWDQNDHLELIMTQKWVALYLQGFEAWAEWRRTGLPVLDPPPEAKNESGEIPRRQGYPMAEIDLNNTNYNQALNLLRLECECNPAMPDVLDTKLWWDKKN